MRRYRFVFLAFSCVYPGGESWIIEQIQAAQASIRRSAYGDAIQQLVPALRAAKRSGANHQTMGALLNDLGYAYRMAGQCQNAIDVLRAAIRISGGSSAARVSPINLLGSYLDCDQSAQAEKYWKQHGQPAAAALPDEEAAALWAAGANVEAVRKHYAEAESLYSKAIAIWERAPDRSLDLVLARTSRAVSRAYLGRLADARADCAYSKDVAAILARAYPWAHASALNNIGVVALIDARLEDAGRSFEEARVIAEACPNCRSAPAILANYAAYLRKAGRSKAAQQAQRQANEAAQRLGRESLGKTIDVSTFAAFPK